MRAVRLCAVAALVALLAATASASIIPHATRTALDDYIAKPDPAFAFTPMPSSTLVTDDYTVTYYNLTSLNWLNATDVDRPTWTHLVAFIVPQACIVGAPSCVASAPFLWITGGDNRVPSDISKDEDMVVGTKVAMTTHAPAIVLKQVPNEPLVFADDPLGPNRRLSPDAILGLSWWHFVKTPTEPEWIVLLPMTKAAIKAMDMAEQVLPTLVNTTGDVAKQFVVSGASKRGWTTWLVAAAVPDRVKAAVPLVLDALGLHNFVHRQWQFYGGYTFALRSMWEYNFTANIDEPNMATLFSIMDPIFYLDRMTMPKLAVNAVGDEFQLPDDQRHWGHDAPAEMKFLMVKDADHTLLTGFSEVLGSIAPFMNTVIRGYDRPTVSWTIDNVTGDISVTTSAPPLSVDVVVGDSAKGVSEGKRDFRWAAMHVDPCLVPFWGACFRPIFWETTQTGLKTISPTTFTASMPTPSSGWRGFFVEVRFAPPAGATPPGQDQTLLFSSPMSVIPLTAPFPDCVGQACRGDLM